LDRRIRRAAPFPRRPLKTGLGIILLASPPYQSPAHAAESPSAQTRAKSAIVFSLMIDGSGSRGLRLIGYGIKPAGSPAGFSFDG